jgi:predicted RNA binding protein YcfA (HicA-like mRNA interferase family)
MAKWEKLLDDMRNNPKHDWKISELQTVASHFAEFGLVLSPPKRGSHFTMTHPQTSEILTVPAGNPIKPVYVKRFVSMIDSITEGSER